MEIHNGQTYKPKVTQGILQKYFGRFNTSPQKAGITEIRLIVLAAINDFFSNKLSANDLSYLATQIYFEIKKPNWFDNQDTELGSALLDANELSYLKWKKAEEQYKTTVKSLKGYLERKKSLLKS